MALALLTKGVVNSFSRRLNIIPKPANTPFSFTIAKLSKERKLISERGSAQSFTLDLGNDVTIEMVEIPEGEFTIGSPEGEKSRGGDERQTPRLVETFYMSRTPVTQAQWQKVAQLPQVKRPLLEIPSTFVTLTNNSVNPVAMIPNAPVETVSWEEAREFCDRLTRIFAGTYRLPKEDEWEYACRAGTTTPFFCGETITPEVANYDCNFSYLEGQERQPEDYKGETIWVNQIQTSNGFGLQGMAGNVWEWCENVYESNYLKSFNTQANANDTSPQSRTIRGGSWSSFPQDCRSAKRKAQLQTVRTNTVGFRIAFNE
ncbi:formylglycine-generating enzyme family protein [Roseofilum casamattae]|uniref:Formylglycine-generating enzyme family protein n=1 Tax=Roseofilum casamattae BLCC-M143 TaxID=3022442 RepID=A0ABT7C171_9CYAN|nr:formylglycine-generating enzyme family protein [Roseofilum casamattae]MDJ1185204.1 formylglycine-generating enzyme family protein [Roseofilum casamattae BLCC-M143]